MTALSDQEDHTDLVPIAAKIVSAYVSNNLLPTEELPKLIGNVLAALRRIGTPGSEVVELVPAIPIKKSVTPDYIFCLEDGKKFKSLKRHIAINYSLSPDEYRQKWNLLRDYPMVAPNYGAMRSTIAKAFGLGRKGHTIPPDGG